MIPTAAAVFTSPVAMPAAPAAIGVPIPSMSRLSILRTAVSNGML